MDIFIISGGSKGLGAALIKQCNSPKNVVFSLSRTYGEGFFIKCDLSKPEDIEKAFHKIKSEISISQVSSITLINNAAVIDPIGPVKTTDMDQIIYNINVNLTAVILLSRFFMKYVEALKIPKKIVNISSGAAFDPFYGWSLYCAAKAGMEHFGRCIATEQESKAFPISVLNISPGIIDTDMQKTLRETDKDKFPLVDIFKEYKTNGDLLHPDHVAQQIIDAIQTRNYQSGSSLTLADL